MCDCVQLSHKRRCSRPSAWRCKTCSRDFCGGCKKNHHAHIGERDLQFEKIEQTPPNQFDRKFK